MTSANKRIGQLRYDAAGPCACASCVALDPRRAEQKMQHVRELQAQFRDRVPDDLDPVPLSGFAERTRTTAKRGAL